MSNSSDRKLWTRAVVLFYIRQNRSQQSRYEIDFYLLEMGCDPILIEKVWRELELPWWHKWWRPTTEKALLLLSFGWPGFVIWFEFFWPNTGCWLEQPGSSPWWLIVLNLPLIWLVYRCRVRLRGVVEAICYAALLLTFLFHVPVFLDMNAASDYGLYPISNLKTADGNFHLMIQEWPPRGIVELYKCNTFEFDCQQISEFGISYSENCRPFQHLVDDRLVVGSNGRISIVNGITGLTYPDVNRATVTIDCINQTILVAPW